MARLASFTAAAKRDGAVDEEDILEWIENAGGDDRFAFSMKHVLIPQSGLAPQAIRVAKRQLRYRKIIRWYAGTTHSDAHLLVPNWDFKVLSTDVGNGRFVLDFAE